MAWYHIEYRDQSRSPRRILPRVLQMSCCMLSNPKTNLIIQDGRAHLQLTNRTYDIIISEPSNPWITGCSNLFTAEFFAAARAALRPGFRVDRARG